HVLVAERPGVLAHPGRHLLRHVKGLLVAAMDIHVEQAGHDLVDGIEGRPDLLPLAEAVEELNGERAQIAALECILTFSQLRNYRGRLLAEILIAATGIHQGAGGKVMASGIVSTEFAVGSFPASERLCARGQAGVDAEGMQQAVWRQRVKILSVRFHRDLAWAISQTDLLHGEWNGLP